MNKQDKGNGKRGIEWTDYTWNPIGGCQHGCRWEMPDGTIATCYAETTAASIKRQSAGANYGRGFDVHYWHPERLDEPLKVKEPARIFLDSMSDLMGHWVPDEQIRAVLDVCAKAHWHQFQLLTKNAPRLLKFADAIPANVWIGASMPPSFMFGKRLSAGQQTKMADRILDVFFDLDDQTCASHVFWLSLEPLSFDIAPLLDYWLNRTYPARLSWLVVGAASNGAKHYQPNPAHVAAVLRLARIKGIPVFMKGNLEWEPRVEQSPMITVHPPAKQLGLFGDVS